jgi:hypothetical protein
MKKKISGRDTLHLMSPELKQAFEEVQKERKEGGSKAPPSTERSCTSLDDLCRYIFKLVGLNGDYQMLMVGGLVRTWVWSGRAFNDRCVKVVENVGPSLPDTHALKELRLVATQVTAEGVKRLQAVFPGTKVVVYTEEDHHRNWQLSQASFTEPGET